MRGLALGAILGVVVAGFLAIAAAPAVAGNQVIPTGLDPLIKDVAVTESQLTNVGPIDDGGTILQDNSHVLLVDDDKQQCPTAKYSTIDAAIAAASPGAIIRVCPGKYDLAPIIVDKPLTIQAVRLSGSPCGCNVGSTPDPRYEAITTTWFIFSSCVTVEGFTVVTNSVPIGFEVDAANVSIRHNVIDGSDDPNSIGVDLAQQAGNDTVDHNCMRRMHIGVDTVAGAGHQIESNDITLTTFRSTESAAGGIGVFVGGLGVSADVGQNRVAGGLSDIGIEVADPAAASVHCNLVAGTELGIVLSTTSPTQVTRVTSNLVQDGATYGIQLGVNTVNNVVVSCNLVKHYGVDGIVIGQLAIGNTIANNRVLSNGVAGMDAQPGSEQNLIKNNYMASNGVYDCIDETAVSPNPIKNVWVCNFGFTEFILSPGICKHY